MMTLPPRLNYTVLPQTDAVNKSRLSRDVPVSRSTKKSLTSLIDRKVFTHMLVNQLVG